MASVNDRHPEYTAERVAEWELMRDVFTGESAIKSKGEIYLPMPSGFTALPDKGAKAYASYKARAQVAEMLAPTIAGMMGIAHGVEIKIELPAGLEYLWENADGKGTPLEALHRRITRNLLLSGRYGLLADAPEAGGDPRLAGYAAETIINWDTEFFVLDESGKTRDGFAWVDVKRFRVLNIVDGRYWQDVYETDLASPARSIVPAARGGKAMTRVPFAVASSVDLDPAIRTPPLIGVARSVIANYQLSADYRHQLYMSGQETLVVINGEAPEAVGAGACIAIQGAEGVTPDVKYVSPTCSGIDAHLKAMEDNRTLAVMAGAKLLEQSDKVEESGKARSLRFRSETATLLSIVQSSCALLEMGLRHAAVIAGSAPEEVIVHAPDTLAASELSPEDAAKLVDSWERGAISYDTLYAQLQKGGIASAERTAQEEFALIERERDAREFDDDEEEPGATPQQTPPRAA